jgi:pSer/pThr/pTyr-binding forkhead associated (FHA) protein
LAIAGSTVRLSFPKGEHRDVIIQPGETTIGSSPDSAVVLQGDGVKPHHVSIVVDQRGVSLVVRSADARTHVNARPVREKAILRLGDILSVDATNIVLKPDTDTSITAQTPVGDGSETMAASDDEAGSDTRYRQAPPKVVLRGVSGPHFGKVVPVYGRLVIGRDAECDLVLDEPEMSRRHAMIEVTPQEIYLRDLGSANGTYVNGVQVKNTALYSGDQIAFDRNRFLIEAPGTPTRKEDLGGSDSSQRAQAQAAAQSNVTQTLKAIRPSEQATGVMSPVTAPLADQGRAKPSESAPTTGWNPWYLIAAGAAIAMALALLFLAATH